MIPTRFQAEEVIRAAASGAIPAPGDVLIRVENGWIFGRVSFENLEGDLDPDQIGQVPFTHVVGEASRGQLPEQIAYEDEANLFIQVNTFQHQVRRGIRTITVVDSPYTWLSNDWHLNVNTDGGLVEVLVPSAAVHGFNGGTDQLHFKKIGRTKNALLLTPSVAGQLIDGYDSAIIRKINRSFTLVSDGTNWWIQ